MDQTGAHLPLTDDDLYAPLVNLPPAPPATPPPMNPPSAPAPAPTVHPLVLAQVVTPISAPAPIPSPEAPEDILPRLKVNEIAPVSKIEEALNGKAKNWNHWSQLMYLLFAVANTKGYVEGHIPVPDPVTRPTSMENWEFNNSFIQMLINKNITPLQKVHTRGCATSHKMWTNLHTIHELTSYLVHMDHIRTLCRIKAAEGMDIPEHLSKLKHVWEQKIVTGSLQNVYNDDFFKQQIVVSLLRSWDQFTNPYVREYKDDNDAKADPKRHIDSQQFIDLIIQEYKLIEARKREEITVPLQGENTNPSLASRMSDPKKAPHNKHHCRQCDKDGHYTLQCRYLHKSKCSECGKFGHNAGSDKCGGQTNNNQNQSSQSNGNKHKGKTNSSGNKKKKESQNADNSTQSANTALHEQLIAMNVYDVADTTADSDDNDDCSYNNVPTTISLKYDGDLLYNWLADTGTTSHITHRRDTFTTYEPITQIPIKGVSNIKVFAIGRGTVYLHSECDGCIYMLQLNKVLHVPHNQNSLLLLGCWEATMGQKFLGENGKLTLVTKEGRSIAQGIRLSNRLYQMTFMLTPAPSSNNISFNALTTAPSWKIWHKRFGHVGYLGLQKLFDKHLVDGLHVDQNTDKPDCIACTEAKLSKSPYGPTIKKFTQPGELTHVDLWGPYDIQPIHGNSYFLLMIDDALWFIMVDFLKAKSQAVQKIKDQMTYLSVRDKTPCTIRMDRGTEFVNDELKTWCHSHGIRLQMTTPYSPSQNGVAERMNRTLVELSCAMIKASDLPEFLWEPAVAHAVYVRNRSFTRYIPSATLYQKWHG